MCAFVMVMRSTIFVSLLLDLAHSACILTDSDVHFVRMYVEGSGYIASQPNCRYNIHEWDVSRVTDMSGVFCEVQLPNPPSWICNFDGGNGITRMDLNLSSWDTSSVTKMEGTFLYSGKKYGISEDRYLSITGIENWDTSRVKSMYGLFYGSKFNAVDLSRWRVSRVENFMGTFSEANSFNSDISSWDVSSATSLQMMFTYAMAFNADISGWNVARVESFEMTFNGATSFNSDISCWDISSAVSMDFMFFNAAAFDGRGVWNWTLSSVDIDSATSIFDGATSISNCTKRRIFDSWSSQNDEFLQSYSSWENFSSCPFDQLPPSQCPILPACIVSGDSALGPLVYEYISSDGVIAGSNACSHTIESWDVLRVTDMSGVFCEGQPPNPPSWTCNFDGGSGITRMDLNLSSWDTSSVTKMDGVFSRSGTPYGTNGDIYLSITGIENWDTSRVESMEWLFYGSFFDGVDLSRWRVSRQKNFLGTFLKASSFNGDISSWDVSSATSLERMFSLAAAFNADISGWNVAKVTSLWETFHSASSFNADISKWNVAKVSFFRGMFQYAHAFNADLSCWTTHSGYLFDNMFDDAESFDARGLWNWNVSGGFDFWRIFYLSNTSNCTKRHIYDSWDAQNSVFHYDFTHWITLPNCSSLDLPSSACGQPSIIDATTEDTVVSTTETSDIGTTKSAIETTTFEVAVTSGGGSVTTDGAGISTVAPLSGSSSSSGLLSVTNIAIAGGGLLAVVFTLVIGWYCCCRRCGATDRHESDIELSKLRKQVRHQSELIKSQHNEITSLKSAWTIAWSELQIVRELAKGSYGTVFRGKYQGRMDVAIKVMFDSSENDPNDDKEIQILQHTRHPRLVMFLGCGMKESDLFIVLEFMDQGSLEKLIEASRESATVLDEKFTWAVRLQILHDVAEGMHFLHTYGNGCIHRDLKSANILLALENGNQLRAKVADFGLSRFVDSKTRDRQMQRLKHSLESATGQDSVQVTLDGKTEEDTLRKASIDMTMTMTCGSGTPIYMSPETWERMERTSAVARLSNKVDVYAFAVIMWEVLERKQAWSELHFTYKIKERVMKGRRPAYAEAPHQDSRGQTEPKSYKPLLERCWENDPHDRPSFSEILKTTGPWLDKKSPVPSTKSEGG